MSPEDFDSITSDESCDSNDDPVLLGFLDSDQEDLYLLQPHFFPSKVGGKPAWLIPENFPSDAQLSCNACGKKLSFLMQVNASRGDEKDDCFHRMLFVFICRICKDQVKVFRSQLPRENNFYAHQEPNYQDETIRETVSGPELGEPFPEFPINDILEADISDSSDEEEDDDEDGENDFNADIDRRYALQRYRDYLERTVGPNAVPGESLDESEMAVFEEWRKTFCPKDMNFTKFVNTTIKAPKQIMRYGGGAPLWYSIKNCCVNSDIFKEDIEDQLTKVKKAPACLCGDSRQYEFQIMPQIISLLKSNDDMEFATICIFTCSDSCNSKTPGYLEEYAHVQQEAWDLVDYDAQLGAEGA